jgi:ATP-dependent DNA helicase RecQ
MIAYADAAGCLRARLLRYFGEEGVPNRCGNCGSCSRTRALSAEELLLVRKILSGVARGGERWGRRKIVAMLRGELDALPDSLRGLSTAGLLAEVPARDVEGWVDAAAGGGLLRATDDSYRTLSLTREGREVMSGKREDVELPVPAARAPKAAKAKKRTTKTGRLDGTAGGPDGGVGGEAGQENQAGRENQAGQENQAAESADVDSGLLGRLKAWRKEVAARKGVPAYVVFHDRTLAEIASARPDRVDRLSELSGIGPAKLALYGEEIIAIVTRE